MTYKMLVFDSGGLLAPCPTLRLEDHPLSDVCDWLFSILTATFHIWRPSPPPAAWGHTVSWWQGTHLHWCDYPESDYDKFSLCPSCGYVYEIL